MRLKVETVTWIEANACHSLKKGICANIIVETQNDTVNSHYCLNYDPSQYRILHLF